MPSVALSDERLLVTRSYLVFDVYAALLPSGYIGVRLSARNISYEVGWANPIWALAEIPVDGQQHQILSRLQDTLTAMPEAPTHPEYLPDSTFGTSDLPLLVPARMRRLARAAWLLFRGSMQALPF